MVIRLNSKKYDSKKFINNGIRVKELFFEDGKCPDNKIIEEFIACVESEQNNIAIHCKAGLGRTGTLIAMYCMKNYKFKGRDFIGWIRLCRPGSVLGPQQKFIWDKEAEMFEKESTVFNNLDDDFITFQEKFKNLSINEQSHFSELDKHILKNGQKGQGPIMDEKKKQKKKFNIN